MGCGFDPSRQWVAPLEAEQEEVTLDEAENEYLGLGEEHVVAAPLQHPSRSRLTIRAHVNPRCCRRSLR